jgi:hypothetical protein
MSADTLRDGWRAPLLQHFTPELAPLCPISIVRDGDELLADVRTVEALEAAGFLVWPMDDPLALRLVYEQQFRTPTPGVAAVALVIAVKGEATTVPFDLLRIARASGRVIDFGIGDVFPSLARSVVRTIDRSEFDTLFEAQRRYTPGPLGENATAEFALRHLFRVAPELVTGEAGLLTALLKLHFDGRELPAMLATRLSDLLEPQFPQWPVRSLVGSAHTFWRFLDERWPVFLQHVVGAKPDASSLSLTGPALLPFGHPDVHVYVDNLFMDGRLTRTAIVARDAVPADWMAVGVASDLPELDTEAHFHEVSTSVRGRLPAVDAPHQQWTAFARLWAEWLTLRYALLANQIADMDGEPDRLHDLVEQRFADWLRGQYSGLHNLSHWPKPVMVHHIGRYMAHRAELAAPQRRRMALLVVDGLALSQWLLVRDRVLGAAGSGCDVEESAAFAWLPTLTSISRQAIFSGEVPVAFGASLLTTAKEETWWRRFWEDRGLGRGQIAYVRQKDKEADADFYTRAVPKIEHPGVYRLGLVVNTVDYALHDAAAEMSWLHSLVGRWRDDGHLPKLVATLIEHDFDVHLTSDHGNIESRGVGKPDAGDVPEISASRVFVFPDPHTRRVYAERFPGTVEWAGVGLPPGNFALMAPSRGSFLDVGSRALSHGGMSLEEVIVPFVTIARRRP